MKKEIAIIKKSTTVFVLAALFVSSFGAAFVPKAHATMLPNWNVTGNYVVDMKYNDTDNLHDVSLIQDGSGNLTGSGGSPSGANTYTWALTSGTVSGDSVTVVANYTATADAVTPQTVLNLTGTIASDGTLSGTWSDNYQAGTRTGTFSTTKGAAVSMVQSSTLSAQDFGVMDVSNVKGYTAGFGLTGATLTGATSVVTQLYSGTTLLQTDTAMIPKFNADITGVQFSSPFDVFGTFNYSTDGYWTNVRASEYGKTLIPTSVVATVTLANGKIVTATNATLTGDTATIFPVINTTKNSITKDATDITATDATLNGANGNTDASGHLFWVSRTPFVTTGSVRPTGVYATADLGAITANTAFSAPLSSVKSLPLITTNTRYYFAAWSDVGGIWYPGAIKFFATGTIGTISGMVTGGTTPGILAVTSVTPVTTTSTADGTFANGWKYIFNITVPTNETHLAMKFGNWMDTIGSSSIGIANNLRISSSQADNANATILLTGANTYSTPTLNMMTDLDPTKDGMQVQVTVETATPLNSINGAYTTSYGVTTN